MDFELNEDQRRFKDDLCQYLGKELTPEVKRANADPDESKGMKHSFVVDFRRKLGENGYLAVGWPGEYGGGDKDMVYQVLAFEEMDYHGVPGLDPAYTYLTQAVIMLGSDEQKRLLLPHLTRGEMDMVVGYSEPEAGSDLANLQTRAVLEGGEFVVNGQKLFCSVANNAQYAWLAVRTDPDAPKHRGISLLVADMKTPGITLARYRTMAGWLHYGMHFDNVRVPRSMLVGELNRGWYHIMAAIDFERAANGNPGHTVWLYDLLLRYCKETKRDGQALIDDPSVRNLLADLVTDVRCSQLAAYWVASMHAQGMHPQHETALVTLVMRETARKVAAAHMELMGSHAQLRPGSKGAPLDGAVEYAYRDDMFFSFAAGGFDITRNVIANRGLGLPRG